MNMNIVENLNVLRKPGELLELRILTDKGVISGLYDNIEKIPKDIEAYEGKYNIFVTINPVKEECKRRGINRLIRGARKTTSDEEIDRISYILVDLDPIRPTKVSSTNEELQSAEELANTIKIFLDEYKFPEPIMAMSGNGYHLLYSVNLENTAENIDIIKKFLNSLATLFNNEKVEVDTKTYNPSRITKLYGTKACKGEETIERSHRRSYIEKIPSVIEAVSEKSLKEVSKLGCRENITCNIQSNDSSINVCEWLSRYGIEILRKKEWQGGILYVLAECPWNENHTDRSSYIIQFSNGHIVAGCHHNSCSNENWNTLKRKYEGIEEQDSVQKKLSQHEIIMKEIEDSNMKFFCNEFEEPFVNIPEQGVYRVTEKKFEMFIMKKYYEATKKIPNKEVINQVINLCTAKACFSDEQRVLSLRCAEKDNAFYYDLADKEHNCVKITSSGVVIEPIKEIMFLKRRNQKEQVKPALASEDITLIDKHYRFKSEEDRILHTISVITSFIPNISHAIIVFHGEKGSSKTTTMRKDRMLIDPTNSEVITLPKSNQDLALNLSNNYLSCFDNLENISAEKSNMLCMACTGGGFTTRTLYTNNEETTYKFKVPIMLNGINVVATKADLLDRCILIELDRIPSYERKEDSEIYAEFEKDKPKILGAIFNIISKAMNLYPSINLKELGRLADFTKWGYAVAEVSGIGGDRFLEAYLSNQSRANQEALDSNPVGNAIMYLLNKQASFEGRVSELLLKLNEIAVENGMDIKSPLWANEANVLSRRLKEIKSNLELQGIKFNIKHTAKGKVIKLEKIA